MATYSTRPPPPLPSGSNADASPPQPPRKPAKKASFLSLRREKRSVPADASSTTSSSARPRAGSHSASPSAYRDLDDALGPATSRPNGLKNGHSRRHSKTIVPTHEETYHHSSWTRSRQQTGQTSGHDVFAFPSPSSDRTSHSSNRSHIKHSLSFTSSSRHESELPAFLTRPLKYSILDSASSTLSQYEDVPRTPVDDLSFREPLFSPVMVAAPAGVETMDALVDGMNAHGHFGVDDQYMGMGGMSGRAKAKAKVSKSGHHPLYHPPLPTPPPGVVLGKVQSQRRRADSSESEDDKPSSRRPSRQRKHRAASSRQGSVTTIADTVISRKASFADTVASPCSSVPAVPGTVVGSRSGTTSSYGTVVKTLAPSISEIIRAHAPALQQTRSRDTSSSHGHNYATVHEVTEPEPTRTENEGELISRSSVDTIAEEIRQTLINQNRSSVSPTALRHQRSFQRPQVLSIHSDNRRSIISSPQSEGRPESSLFSYSTISDQHSLPPLDLRGFTKIPSNSPSQAIAQYLRSARLTTLLSLTRRPHASRETPLTVSLSDLGCQTGFPVVVFLGLGCVRHIMGLYDEMAECLGIRLITIDRWGLGRTDTPRSKSARGIPEWASVVEEVLDRLHIDQCSVMAHSAGAPYALSFANRYPERIRGDVCLLAPWVGGGEGSGYKWLKYVPNGILKTAQAAEWKVQAWMIGKPPTFAFEGIGFDANAPISPDSLHPPAMSPSEPKASPASTTLFSRKDSSEPRPSTSSGLFSDYDDLRDFEGRFESRTSLDTRSLTSQRTRTYSDSKRAQRKTSHSFLNKLKGTQSLTQQSPSQEDKGRGKKLKALRSMGSLRGKTRPSSSRTTSQPEVPILPIPTSPDISFGLDDLPWTSWNEPSSTPSTIRAPSSKGTPDRTEIMDDHSIYSRSQGRRSISFGAAERSRPELPPLSPLPSPAESTQGYQAALGNALIAASHAESAKGTHQDLLQILNHDRQPWGFSYMAFPHTVRVWYGDRDERIAENAVRWMESTMGTDKCRVEVVKGADHALMYRSGLVVDVLEQICTYWREGS